MKRRGSCSASFESKARVIAKLLIGIGDYEYELDLDSRARSSRRKRCMSRIFFLTVGSEFGIWNLEKQRKGNERKVAQLAKRFLSSTTQRVPTPLSNSKFKTHFSPFPFLTALCIS